MSFIIIIINSLESSIRKLLSNDFDNRHTMSWGPKGLRICKINLGVFLMLVILRSSY